VRKGDLQHLQRVLTLTVLPGTDADGVGRSKGPFIVSVKMTSSEWCGTILVARDLPHARGNAVTNEMGGVT
jgi:hypothetical protein